MIITGTHHFVSLDSAIRYYRSCGCDAEGVRAKLEAGEIAIGPPATHPGQTLFTRFGRYHIEEKE